LGSLPEYPEYWTHNRNAINYNPFKRGVEIASSIPPAQEARKILDTWGIKNSAFTFEQAYVNKSASNIERAKKALFGGLGRRGAKLLPAGLLERLSSRGSKAVAADWIASAFLSMTGLLDCLDDKYQRRSSLKSIKYPLARSYSDLFIVSGNSIKDFCRYCGAFAATDLFAELAIPTALALSAEKIVMEKDIQLKGKPIWGAEGYREMEKYGYRLRSLLDDFPKDCLFIHPIKLSKWGMES